MNDSIDSVFKPGQGAVTLYREEECIVFEGERRQTHRIYLDQLATDESLQMVLAGLRQKPWMTASLCEQFLTEVHWLRQQLPPGK